MSTKLYSILKKEKSNHRFIVGGPSDKTLFIKYSSQKTNT